MLAISVVTPCLNAAGSIGQTMQSVINQQDPALEYIVVDGGSIDGTQDVISRHLHDVALYLTRPDGGQYHAIQEGLRQSSGDIQAWLNADDIYFPWTLSTVREIFESFPKIDWIIGIPTHLNSRGQLIRVKASVPAYRSRDIREGWHRANYAGYLQQESMFWRRSLWERAGGQLALALRYAADFELWTRFAALAELHPVWAPLAGFRHRPGEQLSSRYRGEYEKEVESVCATKQPPPFLWRWGARRGVPCQMLIGMLHWARAPVVAYSHESGQWEVRSFRRSLVRESLSNLMLEWHLQRRH